MVFGWGPIYSSLVPLAVILLGLAVRKTSKAGWVVVILGAIELIHQLYILISNLPK